MKILLHVLIMATAVLVIVWFVFWIYSHKEYSVSYGISFNQNHATSLGLGWKEVYTTMLNELQPEYLRIAAMWSEVEAVKGEYDFSNVDWMMDTAADAGAAVVLVVGQKAPRWPECHVPAWIQEYAAPEARDHLFDYVRAVAERYKDHPALELWQVENEAFIGFEFGECEGYDKTAVYDEIALIRQIDPTKKIIITDSGELSTWRKASKAGDLFGTTMYRIVRTPRGNTFSYDWLPAGFYRFKSAFWGRGHDDFFVSELQAEPWFTDRTPLDTSIEEMEVTMNPDRLKKHIDYASHVGASRVYLWGVEWWYYMMQERDDDRYWNIIERTIQKKHDPTR